MIMMNQSVVAFHGGVESESSSEKAEEQKI